MSDAQPVSAGQEYYIRFRGTVLGPYSIEKLKALWVRGQFSRIHEVSTDRKSWSPASSLDDLFVSPASKLVSRSGPPVHKAGPVQADLPAPLDRQGRRVHRAQPASWARPAQRDQPAATDRSGLLVRLGQQDRLVRGQLAQPDPPVRQQPVQQETPVLQV